MERLIYLRDTYFKPTGVPWIDYALYNLCTWALYLSMHFVPVAFMEGHLYFKGHIF